MDRLLHDAHVLILDGASFRNPPGTPQIQEELPTGDLSSINQPSHRPICPLHSEQATVRSLDSPEHWIRLAHLRWIH
jgi:hypothetical protein